MREGRIANRFRSLREQKRKALITYITAGDPDFDTTLALIQALEAAGADICELGVPYSDPLADGPVIQRAAQRALRQGASLQRLFPLVERIRCQTDIPLVLLIYYNQVYQFGWTAFIERCCTAGVDGLVIPDLPLEERRELLPALGSQAGKAGCQEQSVVDLIPLVAPTSEHRVHDIVQTGSGFVYCISSRGVTGVRKQFDSTLAQFIAGVSEQTDLPAAVGFGISSADAVRQLRPYCDGVIVGSAFVQLIEDAEAAGESLSQLVDKVKGLALELRQALDE